jgi:hypothetical protein
LEVANGNRVRLTEILYKTYLSFGERTYITTEKGMCLLRMYNEMEELMAGTTNTREESVIRLSTDRLLYH